MVGPLTTDSECKNPDQPTNRLLRKGRRIYSIYSIGGPLIGIESRFNKGVEGREESRWEACGGRQRITTGERVSKSRQSYRTSIVNKEGEKLRTRRDEREQEVLCTPCPNTDCAAEAVCLAIVLWHHSLDRHGNQRRDNFCMCYAVLKLHLGTNFALEKKIVVQDCVHFGASTRGKMKRQVQL